MDEINKIDENVNSLLNDMELSKEFIKMNGFTDEYLKDVFTKNTLAQRYKQDIIDSFDIDDEKIKAGISYEENRQYDIEYLFISTQKKNDEDSTKVPMDKLEKEAALSKISDLRLKALDTEDWSTIIPDDEEELQYRTSSFLSEDTYFSEKLMDIMLKMENDAITEVIDDEDGYYVIRMINNDSPETYNQKVEKAIAEKEEEAFFEKYTESIYPKYTIELNNKAISNLRMGRITLVD